jgi:hypothetical protein
MTGIVVSFSARLCERDVLLRRKSKTLPNGCKLVFPIAYFTSNPLFPPRHSKQSLPLEGKMEVYVSSEQLGSDGQPVDDITSLQKLLLSAPAVTAEDVKALHDAVKMVWEETERSIEHEVEYWERLGSEGVFGEADTIDALAEEWEQQYFRGKGDRAGFGAGGVGGAAAGGSKKLPKLQASFQSRRGADRGAEEPSPDGAASTQQQHAPPPPPAGVPPPQAIARPIKVVHNVVHFDPKAILSIIDKFDAKLKALPHLDRQGAIPTLTKPELDVLVAGYKDMMAHLRVPKFAQKYGDPSAVDRPALEFGEDVPSYFANVGGESIYRRKELSIAGLCNLLYWGPIIFTQLREKKYSGNPTAYVGDVGLVLMRRVTGNVVDLDTTVLRCNDAATLNVINLSNRHKGLKVFDCASDFADSSQAQEIAKNCAVRLLDDFNARLKISPAEQLTRKTSPSQITSPIPVAQDNSTRGHTPVWHYVNAGQNSFHVNVPTMEDVIGALLRAPMHCVRNYAFLALRRQSDFFSQKEQDDRIDDFFENCVVDSCFNMKWKSIEEYSEALAAEGSIVYVLQRVQQRHQEVFTAELFAKDEENNSRALEIDAMWRLVQSEQLYGRDPDSGSLRPITLADVTAWVKST